MLLFATALLVATCIRARAADLPAGVDCATIRQYVAEHGKAAAIKWAIENGYSFAQIRNAIRCLK